MGKTKGYKILRVINAGGKGMSFRNELETLINKHSAENKSNTPDFILARFIEDSLDTFDKATASREEWYGRSLMSRSACNL